MATLRHQDNVGQLVLLQPHRVCAPAHIAVRDCSCARATRVKPRQRANWLRSTGHVLLIGCDLLFALWAIAAVAFWVAIIVGLML